MRVRTFGRFALPPLLLGSALLGAGVGPARANFVLYTTIAVPAGANNTVGGAFNGFDISFFDPVTNLDYVSDRSNASIDVFDATTNTFVGRIGTFVGTQALREASGPAGNLVVDLPGQHQLWAGDGDSTLKGFDLNNANAPLPNTPIATGPTTDNRVDEMGYSPQTHTLLVMNDAPTTGSPFGTLIDTNTDTITHQIVLDGTNGAPNATAGVEQPAWDANTGLFYVTIPEIGGGGPGGIAAIDPGTGNVTQTFDFAAFGVGACGPTGLALTTGNRLFVGCGDASGHPMLFDPTANGGLGALLNTFSQVGGGDEVWFDPLSGLCFDAASSQPGGAVLGVIACGTETWLQNIPTSPGAHSVAAGDGEVFVPLTANPANTICPDGCIAVFREAPEPSPLSVLVVGLLGLVGFGALRRRAL